MAVITDIQNILQINWVNTLIGLMGGAIITYIFFQRSFIGAQLVYVTANLNLIGKDNAHIPDDVSILYKGEVVPRLSKTFIILWNKGTRTLLGEHTVDLDKFRISFPKDVQILSANVIKQTKKANGFVISVINRNDLLCNFDFLHKRDGVTIEVIHTGMNVLPTISGTFKDMPEGIRSYKPEVNSFLYYVFQIAQPFAIVFIFPMLIIPLWIGAHVYKLVIPLAAHSIAVIVGLMSGGASFWLLIKLADKLFKRKPYASSLSVEGIGI